MTKIKEIEQTKRFIKVQLHRIEEEPGGILVIDLTVNGQRFPFTLHPSDSAPLAGFLRPLINEMRVKGILEIHKPEV